MTIKEMQKKFGSLECEILRKLTITQDEQKKRKKQGQPQTPTHIAQLFAIYSTPEIKWLVMERCDRHLSSWTTYPAPTVHTYLKQLLADFIHSLSIVHFDVKPNNILLNNNVVRLIDFGCARYCEPG